VGVLVLGLGTGLVASYVGQNFTLIGSNGPDDLSYVPSDARMVAYADVRDLVNSELRQKMRQFEPQTDARNQFETATGLNIEQDVDTIVAAAWAAPGGPQGPPLLLARGRFDSARIETVIREHGGTVEDYNGQRLLLAEQGKVAVSFVEPGLVAAGDAAAVRRAIDTKKAGSGSVTDNADLMKLIKDVKDEGNAWAVAKLDSLPAGLPPQLTQQLPPINWFSASGRVDSGVRGTVRVEAKDEKSASDLREVVRGFMALVRLQTGQKPEFADLVNSLELGGQGTTVSLSFSVPSSLIDTLAHTAQLHRQQMPRTPVVPEQQQAPAAPSL
jgi:hypothetical protein